MSNTRQLTHLSLFSGIGGLDLAAEMAGFKTVGQCEWADYQTKVLEKHWPDVPRWRDIRTLTKDSFYEKTGLRTVDIISGGFPCQPFSLAGYRRGKEDDRFLWPEMLRVIRELNPTWVLGENVPGIVNLALDEVLTNLEEAGYSCQAFIIPACGVDAPHKRERCAILAYSSKQWWNVRRNRSNQDSQSNGEERPDNGDGTQKLSARERWQDESAVVGMADGLRTEVHGTDADSCCFIEKRSSGRKILESPKVTERLHEGGLQSKSSRTCGMHSAWEDWPAEPGMDRVVDGVPNRADRIKCLGNAVVPQQFYPFFEAIYKIERGEM